MEPNQQNKRTKKNQRQGDKEQTDSDQRGGRRWVSGEGGREGGQVKEQVQRTHSQDNGVQTVFGRGGWTGQGRAMGGGEWGQL